MHAPKTVPQEALILMADIFPTGYFASKNAWLMFNEVERKDATAVVIGCGPVGLCAVTAATHFFKNVYAIDSVPERLAEAKKHGASEVFNFKDSNVDIPARIKELTEGRGADAVLEVVGAQSAMDMAIKILRPWGVISSCGIHTHELKLNGLDLYSECGRRRRRRQIGIGPTPLTMPFSHFHTQTKTSACNSGDATREQSSRSRSRFLRSTLTSSRASCRMSFPSKRLRSGMNCLR